MIRYVHIQESHPDNQEKLIASYRTMWNVNRTKYFFHRGIVTNTKSFKNLAILPELGWWLVTSSHYKIFTGHFTLTSSSRWIIHWEIV